MEESHQTEKRIGLLGGTFDPPHVGHLLLAQTALEQLSLDEVWWLPVGDPTHKSRSDLTSAVHRINMVQALVKHHPQFIVDTIDAERTGPHYTATLLPILRDKWPNSVFWYVIGADSLRDFHKWYKPQTVIEHCRLAVLPRPQASVDWDLLATIPNLKAKVDVLLSDGVDVSSTMVRKLTTLQAAGDWLTSEVEGYIIKHKLYQFNVPI